MIRDFLLAVRRFILRHPWTVEKHDDGWWVMICHQDHGLVQQEGPFKTMIEAARRGRELFGD